MDWTDFDADDQTTLALNLVTNHGRATPLLWLTVLKDELKDKRNDYETPPIQWATNSTCKARASSMSSITVRKRAPVPSDHHGRRISAEKARALTLVKR